MGKGSSLTIKRLKSRRNKNGTDKNSPYSSDDILESILKDKENSNSEQKPIFISKRWFTISVDLVFLIMSSISILKIRGFFDLALLGGLTIDLFIFLLSLNFYKKMLIQKNYSLKFTNKIQEFIFGPEDISDNAMMYTFILMFLIMPFALAFYHFIPSISFFLFLLSFLIYIIAIWNNQFKTILSKLFQRI